MTTFLTFTVFRIRLRGIYTIIRVSALFFKFKDTDIVFIAFNYRIIGTTSCGFLIFDQSSHRRSVHRGQLIHKKFDCFGQKYQTFILLADLKLTQMSYFCAFYEEKSPLSTKLSTFDTCVIIAKSDVTTIATHSKICQFASKWNLFLLFHN